MNFSRRLLSNVWKFADRSRSLNGISPFYYFFLQVITKLTRTAWKIMNWGQKNYAESIFQIPLKKRRGDFTYEFCLYGYCGTFLADELEKISEPTVFIDIGANIGLFSLIAAKNSKIEEIYSFEPDPRTLPYLKDNLLKSNCSQVEVIPYAISTDVGTHTLYIEENHSGASSLVPTDRSYDSIEISTVNEKYLNENLLIGTLSQVFVKIDVEGHEQTVLSVLKKWIHFHAVTKIFLEFDTYLSDVDKIKNLLISEGFQSEKRLGSSTHWDELYVRRS